MRFDFCFIGKIIGIQIVLCLLFGSDLRAATYSGCNDYKHWSAILYYKLDSCFWYHTGNIYSPSQFFTSSGTKIPGYDPRDTLRQLYEFRDSACVSNSWDLVVKGYSYVYGNENTSFVVSVDVSPKTTNVTYRDAKRKKLPEAVCNQHYSGDQKLRDSKHTEPFVMEAKFSNDTLFYYDCSTFGIRKPCGIYLIKGCCLRRVLVYWRNYGGEVTSVSYRDYDNGGSSYEDFSDCSNISSFPKCTPPPVPKIKAKVVAPSCADSFLHLSAYSDLLTHFHWLGPDGFESNAKDTSIYYKDVIPGRYMLWGRMDDCSPNVIDEINIPVSEIEKRNNQTLSSCMGDTIFVGNIAHYVSGIYVDTLHSAGGCDSIVTSNLTFTYRKGFLSDSICSGSKYFFGGKYLTESGYYRDTIKTADGCDSIITLNLSLFGIKTDIYDTICSGQSYVSDGKKFIRSGVYITSFKTGTECDSVVVLHLTVNPPKPSTNIYLNICHDDSITFGDKVFSDAGMYVDTLVSATGCDSVCVYHVSYLPRVDTSLVYRICSTDRVSVNGSYYSTDTTFSYLEKYASHECPMNVKVSIFTYHPFSIADKEYNMCGTHIMRVSIDSLPNASYLWEPSVGLSSPYLRSPYVSVVDSQIYKVKVTSNYCTDTVKVKVASYPNPIISAINVDAVSKQVDFSAGNGTSPYYYKLDSTADWQTENIFTDLKLGAHVAFVKDRAGCTVSKPFRFFIPVVPSSVLTPNGDGINDMGDKEYTGVFKIRCQNL